MATMINTVCIPRREAAHHRVVLLPTVILDAVFTPASGPTVITSTMLAAAVLTSTAVTSTTVSSATMAMHRVISSAVHGVTALPYTASRLIITMAMATTIAKWQIGNLCIVPTATVATTSSCGW